MRFAAYLRPWRRGTFADHQLWSKRSVEYGAGVATDSGEQEAKRITNYRCQIDDQTVGANRAAVSP
jgi:hypothetical protein